MEMICAIVRQLTQDLTPEEIQKSGFDTYYVDHTLGLWPMAAGGIPHNACEYQSKGDPITDLLKIWPQNRKPERLTITFYAWSRIRKYVIRSVSCGNVKWYTSSVSVRDSASSPTG